MAEQHDPSTSGDASATQAPASPRPPHGDLVLPAAPIGVVILASNVKDVAHEGPLQGLLAACQKARLATCVVHPIDWEPTHWAAQQTYVHRCVQQVLDAVAWISRSAALSGLPIGYLGRDVGAVAAMHAAAAQPDDVSAVVLLDGVLDAAASDLLARVTAPTLLIEGSEQSPRHHASGASLLCHLACTHEQARVPGVHPLQTERGAAESARLACAWFMRHFAAAGASARRSSDLGASQPRA
jgi:hypothetical protein